MRGPEVDLPDDVGSETAGHALVGDRGVHVAVAEHDRAALEGGADESSDVLRARGGVQQGLGPVVEAGEIRGEDDVADGLGRGGTPGLTGHHDLEAAAREGLGEQARLRRLARAIAALERDEQSSTHARTLRPAPHAPTGPPPIALKVPFVAKRATFLPITFPGRGHEQGCTSRT